MCKTHALNEQAYKHADGDFATKNCGFNYQRSSQAATGGLTVTNQHV